MDGCTKTVHILVCTAIYNSIELLQLVPNIYFLLFSDIGLTIILGQMYDRIILIACVIAGMIFHNDLSMTFIITIIVFLFYNKFLTTRLYFYKIFLKYFIDVAEISSRYYKYVVTMAYISVLYAQLSSGKNMKLLEIKTSSTRSTLLLLSVTRKYFLAIFKIF